MSRLKYYVQRAGVPEVIVRLDQVAELIGEARATDLAIWVNGEQEIRTRYNHPRSSVPKPKRLVKQRLACYKTAALLEALDAQPVKSVHSGLPNQSLLPSEKVEELQQRGLMEETEEED